MLKICLCKYLNHKTAAQSKMINLETFTQNRNEMTTNVIKPLKLALERQIGKNGI